jgi:hypothetical protein
MTALPTSHRISKGKPGMVGTMVVRMAAAMMVLAACVPAAEPRPPVNLSVRIATRSSCGSLTTTDYDVGCMTAFSIVVRDAAATGAGGVLSSHCEVVPNRQTLGEILFSSDQLASMTGVSSDRPVIIEVRGSHSLGAGAIDPCTAANDPANWLLWGQSEVVNLATQNDLGAPINVIIFIDCRDCEFSQGCLDADCFGCKGLGLGTCPVALPASYCAPIDLSCDRSCADNSDCFGGARTCIDQRCDTELLTGGLCSPCGRSGGVVVGCDAPFQCVARPGQSQGICAPRCPDAFCPQGTRCSRQGNGLEVVE